MIDKFYLALRTEPNPYATRLGGKPGGQLFILMCRRSPSQVGRNIEENMQQKNAINPTHDALLERFRQAFPEAAIQLDDESHLHVGHAGAGHFRVRVIDARFNGLQHIALMKLNYVVITSVDRDDLRDGGAGHFVACITRVLMCVAQKTKNQWKSLLGRCRTGKRLNNLKITEEAGGFLCPRRGTFSMIHL